MTNLTFEQITKTKPEKSLTVELKRTGGRNNMGKLLPVTSVVVINADTALLTSVGRKMV